MFKLYKYFTPSQLHRPHAVDDEVVAALCKRIISVGLLSPTIKIKVCTLAKEFRLRKNNHSPDKKKNKSLFVYIKILVYELLGVGNDVNGMLKKIIKH